jgi:hypothetical protein
MKALFVGVLACLTVSAAPAASLADSVGNTQAAAHIAGVDRPLILGLVEPNTNLPRLSQRLRATARVPVHKLAELSPQQVSLTLHCKSQRQCDAAQARLAAATSWVRSVDVDAVRTRPTPAAASSARSL